MTTTAPPRPPRPGPAGSTRRRRAPGTETGPPRPARRYGAPGAGAAAGVAAARAVPLQAVPAADDRPDLHVVERQRSLRPGLLGTVAVSGAFIALFVLAALQAALVQGQLRLDRLHADVNERKEVRDRLALQVNTLESPERLAEAAQKQGMVPAPDVVFLYAPLPGGSAPEVVPTAEPAGGAGAAPGGDPAAATAGPADATTSGGRAATEPGDPEGTRTDEAEVEDPIRTGGAQAWRGVGGATAAAGTEE